MSKFRVVKRYDKTGFLYYIQKRHGFFFWRDVPGLAWTQPNPAITYARNLVLEDAGKSLGDMVVWRE